MCIRDCTEAVRAPGQPDCARAGRSCRGARPETPVPRRDGGARATHLGRGDARCPSQPLGRRLPGSALSARVARSLALSLLVSLVSVVTLTVGTAGRAYADEATDPARAHYETGLQLFYARAHAPALIEFQRAHEVKPRPATLFMMAQCEYLLGQLRQAREHYEAYLADNPNEENDEEA